ncbi:unnamed protein product, partial [Brassica rapa subsp. narinosa]
KEVTRLFRFLKALIGSALYRDTHLHRFHHVLLPIWFSLTCKHVFVCRRHRRSRSRSRSRRSRRHGSRSRSRSPSRSLSRSPKRSRRRSSSYSRSPRRRSRTRH